MERREFIRTVTLTAVAATASGAGVAVLTQETNTPATITVVETNPATPPAPNPVASTTQDDLLAQLLQAQAENRQLQTALDTANQRLANMETVQPTSEVLRMELNTANDRITLLAGLLALYEELENATLSETIDEGLAHLDTLWTTLTDKLPELDTGLTIGKQALDELEEHIPTLEDGRVWLEEQMNQVSNQYGQLESILQTIVETARPVLDMINEWFEDILKWLPFNIGQKAVEVMGALRGLISLTPPTLSGLRQAIADPLDSWLTREDETNPTALQKNVTMPIREGIFQTAVQLSEQNVTLKEAYYARVDEPAKTAVAQQHLIKTLIAQYREQHQL